MAGQKLLEALIVYCKIDVGDAHKKIKDDQKKED